MHKNLSKNFNEFLVTLAFFTLIIKDEYHILMHLISISYRDFQLILNSLALGLHIHILYLLHVTKVTRSG